MRGAALPFTVRNELRARSVAVLHGYFQPLFFRGFVALRGELAQLPPDRVGIQMEGSFASHERTELTGDRPYFRHRPCHAKT